MQTKRNPMEKGYLTTQELADLVQVNKSTLIRWIKGGKVADCQKKGKNGMRYWEEEDIKKVREYHTRLNTMVRVG